MTLLRLILLGINANNLEKTLHILSYIEVISYIVLFYNLIKEKIAGYNGQVQEDNIYTLAEHDLYLAKQQIASQILQLEEGDINIDYKELDNYQEKVILKLYTVKVLGFVALLFNWVFALLEKLERPNSFRLYSGHLENKVLYMLRRVSTIFLIALLLDLFNIALDRIAKFVVSTSFQQIRSVVGFLYNVFIKVNPKKSLKRLIPLLITSIYREINNYRAGIIVDMEVLLGDRILVWTMHLLGYSLTEVRDSILAQKEELFAIIKYVQLECKGRPKIIASDITSRLLYNLTAIYIIDYLIYKKDELKNKLIM